MRIDGWNGTAPTRRRSRAGCERWRPRLGEVDRRGGARSSDSGSKRRRRRRCASSPSASARGCRSRSGSTRRRSAAAPGLLDPEVREALRVAARNIEAVARAELEARARPATAELPEGQRVEVREEPVAAAGVYAPGGRAAYPSSVLMCCVPARVAGVAASRGEPARCRRAAQRGGAGGLRDRGRGRGLRDRRSAGDRRPGVRHRDDRPRRPDRRPREPLRDRGQATGLGPGRHRWVRRAHRADGGRRRHGEPGVDRARPLRPGRARRRQPADRGLAGPRAPGPDRGAGLPSSPPDRPSVAEAPLALVATRGLGSGADARRRGRTRAPGARIPGGGRDGRPRAGRRLRVHRRGRRRRRSATTPPARTTSCQPAGRRASAARWAREPSGAGPRSSPCRAPPPAPSPPTWAPWRAPRAFPCTASPPRLAAELIREDDGAQFAGDFSDRSTR